MSEKIYGRTKVHSGVVFVISCPLGDQFLLQNRKQEFYK